MTGIRQYQQTTTTCAQRLSASEGSSPSWRRQTRPGRPCAQRLSAPEGSSLSGRLTVYSLPFGCSAPFGIRGFTGVDEHVGRDFTHVLNAFRHQRIRRTGQERTGDRLPPVLNAFRHQRVHRNYKREVNTGLADRCSTPFGIRGSIACISTASRCRFSRAQRLAASEGSSLSPAPELLRPVVVLNALRHQRVRRLSAAA